MGDRKTPLAPAAGVDRTWTDDERRQMCAAHLADLKRAHRSPPADVRVREGNGAFVPPPASRSSSSSPAAWLADDIDAEEDGGGGVQRPTPAVTLVCIGAGAVAGEA